jgi:hypothetical protein
MGAFAKNVDLNRAQALEFLGKALYSWVYLRGKRPICHIMMTITAETSRSRIQFGPGITALEGGKDTVFPASLT